MLTHLLTYKDDDARMAYDPSADAFHGRVIGMRDVIDFYGRTPAAWRAAAKDLARQTDGAAGRRSQAAARWMMLDA